MTQKKQIFSRLPPVQGLVLAGGQGQRVGGQDKGWIEYRGRALIHTTVECFAPQVASVLISANRNLEAYQGMGYEVICDPEGFGEGAYQGPLLGVYAALRQCCHQWLACVPCDVPGLPVDLVAALQAAVGGAAAAYVRSGERNHYLCCLLKPELHHELRQYLGSGQRAVKHWMAEIGAIEVEFPNAEQFANLNTFDDFSKPVKESEEGTV